LAKTQQFDRILVDAPCPNTGVLCKRAEARWRYSPAKIAEAADLGHLGSREEPLSQIRCEPTLRVGLLPGGQQAFGVHDSEGTATSSLRPAISDRPTPVLPGK
ncbi:MAG: hypothetical protein GY724_17580, partial [Actinomycetia bacterium]|nr:hypothetical protein [Actinomycetes bacterium]